jgi:hypothetical protein
MLLVFPTEHPQISLAKLQLAMSSSGLMEKSEDLSVTITLIRRRLTALD